MGSKGRPWRTLVVDGWEILIGRGEVENDELTFAAAAPEDFWLHVAGGVPGSHVVVRNPAGADALPPAVVTRAAELAVEHSKARGRGRVDVHLCHVADVRKPHRAPPGAVELVRWTRVRVGRVGRC